MNWKVLLFVGLLGLGAFQHFQAREVMHGAGEMAPETPLQSPPDVAELQSINGYALTPLATFAVKARVLAAKNYHFGRETDLSPLDLALGWGQMSDGAVLGKIDISQSNRFYFWHVDEFPIPREAIETQSANMHMIPADDRVDNRLKSIRAGQIVQLSGYLVEAKASDGWHWKSSLTRNDTGNGACELMLVNRVEVASF